MLKAFKLKYVILLRSNKLALFLIIFNVVLSARWVIDGNIFFHTDIARDFLLMEDIVDNKHPTLIGPRSGAIPGLFHGPLWLYLNLPTFVIGGGNPAVVGWFWVILYLFSIGTTYYIGKKLFGKDKGLLAALLLSSATILNVRTLFNPYGALLLSPIYFYFLALYLQTKKIKILILSFFLLGLIIQFQLAFGVPILFLTFIYLTYYLFRIKKLRHLVSLFILLIPLSSYLLFDLRNNFLQIKSVINYFFGTQTHGKLDLNVFQLVSIRLKESVVDGLGLITSGNIYLSLLLLLFFIFTLLSAFKKKSKNFKGYFLVIFFYLGFWSMTIFFKGPVWNYYFLPFLPLLILLFVALKNYINRLIFYALFILIYAINLQAATADISMYTSDSSKQDVSTWKFNQLVAQSVFAGSEKEFGYFIFTPDLYGYSPMYALNFYQKQDQKKKAYPYQKRSVTYLVIAPPPEYGKDPNSLWYQKNINSESWKANDIKISRKPDDLISFQNGFMIEKYDLSEDEIKVEPNSYLIKDIFFR